MIKRCSVFKHYGILLHEDDGDWELVVAWHRTEWSFHWTWNWTTNF